MSWNREIFLGVKTTDGTFLDCVKLSVNLIKYFATEMSSEGTAQRTIVNVYRPKMVEGENDSNSEDPIYETQSKTMESITKSISTELTTTSIRVNNIKVDLGDEQVASLDGDKMKIPDDILTNVVNTILYLSSPLSDAINGETMSQLELEYEIETNPLADLAQ